MNVLAWNCQRAGAELTKKHLEELHRCFQPSFLFLSETKNNRFFCRICKFHSAMIGNKIFITFVYGDPVVEYREYVWERLTRMSLNCRNVWLMIGDFNKITGNHEKRGGGGGGRRAESSFFPFRNMISNSGMIDFPYTGNSLSWVGRRVSGKVKCRLDRAIGNGDWHFLFSHTSVEYLKLWDSDHRPVLAKICSVVRKRRKIFNFDKRWLGKPGFKEAVISGWGDFNEAHHGNFHQKVVSCPRLIEDLKNQIDIATADDNTTLEELEDLRRHLCTAFREEESFWSQKSRNLWHKDGDQNTKFHHALTKLRRARNLIICLKDKDGNLAENPDEIEAVAVQYF
ncbi:hypothetical protein N665_1970s0001 [Sinapis alba]|nr:hypothetical protein N665_1970s0001 [Sinapis alba]